MIDFYSEYSSSISPTDSLQNIQYVIDDKLTNELHDKQSQGHAERLTKLQEAKRVFATAASRQKYDQDLADSKKVVDPNAKRKAEFRRWFDEAIRYYKSKQYDYAKNSIEHAIQNSVDGVLDAKFYSYAARIYGSTENFDQALDYANETIIHSKNRPIGYRIKKSVLDRSIRWNAQRQYPDWDKINKLYLQLKDTLIEWRTHTTTNEEKAKTFGLEAILYYQYNNFQKYPVGQPDNRQAEALALKAYNLDYSEEQASKILRDIISGYENSKEFEKALKLLEKCEKIADKNKIQKEWNVERQRVAQQAEAERRRLKAEQDRLEAERQAERRRQEAERLAEQRRQEAERQRILNLRKENDGYRSQIKKLEKEIIDFENSIKNNKNLLFIGGQKIGSAIGFVFLGSLFMGTVGWILAGALYLIIFIISGLLGGGQNGVNWLEDVPGTFSGRVYMNFYIFCWILFVIIAFINFSIVSSNINVEKTQELININREKIYQLNSKIRQNSNY